MRKLFQVYDNCARLCVGPLVPFGADRPAVRMFYDLLGNKQTDPGQHPRDYSLLLVGEQDEVSGLVSMVPVQVVATGIDFEEKESRDAAQLSLLKAEA